IDKNKLMKQYVDPTNPYQLAHQYPFERNQGYLAEDVKDFGCCVWDQNKIAEDAQRDQAARLVRDGSPIEFWSDYHGGQVSLQLKIDRVLDVSAGRSEDSVGIQVADFFASLTASYYKAGKPSDCGWWNLLEVSLRR